MPPSHLDKLQADIFILNKISNAPRLKPVDREQGLDLPDRKPPLMHLVSTGRDAHSQVIDRAATASEIIEGKHVYQKGIEPQPGIDY